MTDNVTALPVKSNRAEDILRETLSTMAQSAKPEDLSAASNLATQPSIRIETVKPVVAAIIFERYNKINRSFSVSKVYDYVEAMKRNEWKLNHQGIAFYSDNTLADGQHRMAAVAISNTNQTFCIYPNFSKEAIDTIDRSTRRTAGEALQMMGVDDGKVKAAIAKSSMEYTTELTNGKKPRLTDPQIERFVIDNDELLTSSIKIGRDSLKNVSDPCIGENDSSLLAYLMISGGYSGMHVVGFISSIQQGVATYPESPTVDLSRQFLRAKVSDNSKDRLNKKEKMALALKGASLWLENKSVAKVKWNPAKESLPSNHPPMVLQNAS